jgi:membrane associated rhomboid family serine protease
MVIAKPIAWLIALVIAMSAFGSLIERMGIPVVSYSVLIVAAVWQGQLWRLLTWAPLELAGFNLLFGCLLIYFVGPDLARRWGTRRFFTLYFGGAALVAAITCVVGRVWPDVLLLPYTGLWPMNEALVIAWAALNPDRQMLLFFALPVAGRNLIALTIAVTVIFAAKDGFAYFVPHFAAELLALTYTDVISIRPWILKARLALFQRRYQRRTAKLTRIDRGPDEPPRWTH